MEKSLQKVNNGTASKNDYEILSVNTSKIFGNNGVDISKLNEKVKGQNLDITNVQSTVYSIADELKNSQVSKDALKRINAGTASLNDYSTLGISGVISSNLSSINSVIKITRDEKNQDLTKEEIQEIVNELPNKIEEANNKINKGEGTLKDYALVGITNATTSNLEDVNWYVKGKDNSTINKLQSNVNTIINTLRYINNGSTSTSYYTTIGITTVNSSNITAVANSVKAKKADKGSDLTRAEIVKVVEEVINNIANNISLETLYNKEMLESKDNIQIIEDEFDNSNLKEESSIDIVQDDKNLEEKEDDKVEEINADESIKDFDNKSEENVKVTEGKDEDVDNKIIEDIAV